MPRRVFRLPRFLRRFCGNRERQLRELALDAQAGAGPLTITEVCHPRFSAVLAGWWREMARTDEACELASAAGTERLSVSVLSLVVPLASGELARAGQRLLTQRQAGLEAAGGIHWTDSETCWRDDFFEARAAGHQPATGRLYMLLERVGAERVLWAVLSAQAEPAALAAFTNRATVLFDRLTIK